MEGKYRIHLIGLPVPYVKMILGGCFPFPKTSHGDEEAGKTRDHLK
jgi:hypothetical protein